MRTKFKNIAIDKKTSEIEINFNFKCAGFWNFQTFDARLPGSSTLDLSKNALWEFGAVLDDSEFLEKCYTLNFLY